MLINSKNETKQNHSPILKHKIPDLRKMKVLNLYAGIGGNRKLWTDVDVTAIEISPEIAEIYKDNFPNDNVIVDDAHKYLVENYDKFDFIWSSPPCPTHSQFRYRCGHLAWGQEAVYPDMTLYQEIIFLKYYAKCKWVVENTESYYEPLVRCQKVARHYFWANFLIPKLDSVPLDIKKNQIAEFEDMRGFDLSKYKIADKRKLLRNCVNPDVGLHVFNAAFRTIQVTVGDFTPNGVGELRFHDSANAPSKDLPSASPS